MRVSAQSRGAQHCRHMPRVQPRHGPPQTGGILCWSRARLASLLHDGVRQHGAHCAGRCHQRKSGLSASWLKVREAHPGGQRVIRTTERSPRWYTFPAHRAVVVWRPGEVSGQRGLKARNKQPVFALAKCSGEPQANQRSGDPVMSPELCLSCRLSRSRPLGTAVRRVSRLRESRRRKLGTGLSARATPRMARTPAPHANRRTRQIVSSRQRQAR